jgi:hypothetical protein
VVGYGRNLPTWWGLDRICPRCGALDGTCLGFEVVVETGLGLYSMTGFGMKDLYYQNIAVVSELTG